MSGVPERGAGGGAAMRLLHLGPGVTARSLSDAAAQRLETSRRSRALMCGLSEGPEGSFASDDCAVAWMARAMCGVTICTMRPVASSKAGWLEYSVSTPTNVSPIMIGALRQLASAGFRS